MYEFIHMNSYINLYEKRILRVQINVYKFISKIFHIQINVNKFMYTNSYIRNRIKNEFTYILHVNNVCEFV